MSTSLKFISTADAAALMHVDERHVRLLLSSGKLRGQKIGGRWLVSAAAVDKFTRHPTKGRPKLPEASDLQQS